MGLRGPRSGLQALVRRPAEAGVGCEGGVYRGAALAFFIHLLHHITEDEEGKKCCSHPHSFRDPAFRTALKLLEKLHTRLLAVIIVSPNCNAGFYTPRTLTVWCPADKWSGLLDPASDRCVRCPAGNLRDMGQFISNNIQILRGKINRSPARCLKMTKAPGQKCLEICRDFIVNRSRLNCDWALSESTLCVKFVQ